MALASMGTLPTAVSARNPVAEQVHRLVLFKRLTQLSFAFTTQEEGPVTLADGTKANELRAVNVHEFSFVAVGANPTTFVESVYTARDIRQVRLADLELRLPSRPDALMVQPLLWGTLDALFRDAHLNFGYAPGRVPTLRVECELADGQRVASYFSFKPRSGDVVTEMSTLVHAATGVPDAGG